jgi:protein-S-isoprenylcysteine O-methyltransferase Ste14
MEVTMLQPMQSNGRKPRLERSGINRLVQVFVTLLVMAVVLFLAAGRLDWAAAWIFLGLYVLAVLTLGVWATHKNPDVVNERGKLAKNTKSWDKILMTLYTVLLFVVLAVAGLDAGRSGGSVMPVAVQVVGFVGLVLAMALTYWAMAVNPFLSALVRIQGDRGHHAITSGPYRYVRHPMYAATLVMWPGIALALGSGWALIPAVAIDLIFVIRTALEDRTLQAELPGYVEYAQRVHYRLVPGVW